MTNDFNLITFCPEIKSTSERDQLIANNSTAAARFFHFMVTVFLKHILHCNLELQSPGIFGRTSAYYGSVEQQERLTLHLHLLGWLENALSHQEIRKMILNGEKDFENEIISYLESCQKGEFLTGTMDEVKETFQNVPQETQGIHKLTTHSNNNNDRCIDPTLTLPDVPPDCDYYVSDNNSAYCNQCEAWWASFQSCVDQLLFKCNVHKCMGSKLNANSSSTASRGCLDKDGFCTAQFPRDTFQPTYHH